MKLRHALRALTRRPVSTISLVGVMTLGVALTTAMFVFASPFVLKSLPYSEAAGLLIIRLTLLGTRDVTPAAIPTLAEWRSYSDLFVDVAAFEDGQQLRRIRTKAGTAVAMLTTRSASENLFEVLGVPALYSGQWKPDDGSTTASIHPVALLPGGRFGLQSAASYMDAESGEIFRVAVHLPQEFVFPEPLLSRRPDAVVSATFDSLLDKQRGSTKFVRVIARIRPGVTSEAVRNRLSLTLQGSGLGVQVDRLDEYLTRSTRPLAWAALVAALLVVCACAANAANLVAVRTAHRTQEFVTRRFLGASSRAIAAQIAIEAALVAACTIVSSVVFANAIVPILSHSIPLEYVSLRRSSVDADAIIFAGGLTVLVTLVATTPAWVAVRLRRAARAWRSPEGDQRRLRWLRMASICFQSLVAMVLLVGAVLLVRSSIQIWSQDSGFSGDVAVATVSYPRDESSDRLAENIRLVAADLSIGIASHSAGAIVGPFLDNSGLVGGYTMSVAGRRVAIMPKEVTANYFQAVGATVVAGRPFTETDRGWAAVVVDETLAKHWWPERNYRDVIGERIGIPGEHTSSEVVGVVHDMYDRAYDRAPIGTVFRPLTMPLAALSVNFVMRLEGPPADYSSLVRRAVRQVNAAAIVIDVDRLDRKLGDTVRARSFNTILLSCFSIAAVGVTSLGLLGVVGFVIVRRTKEIAIRRALGATSWHVIRIVSGEAIAAAACGACGGVVAGYMGSRLLSNQIYGIEPHDPFSMVGAAVVMTVLIASVCISAAYRALLVSPSRALRME